MLHHLLRRQAGGTLLFLAAWAAEQLTPAIGAFRHKIRRAGRTIGALIGADIGWPIMRQLAFALLTIFFHLKHDVPLLFPLHFPYDRADER